MKRRAGAAGHLLAYSSRPFTHIADKLRLVPGRRVNLYVQFRPDFRITAATLKALKAKMATELQLQADGKLSSRAYVYKLRFVKQDLEHLAHNHGMSMNELMDQLIAMLKSEPEICNVARDISGLLAAKAIHTSDIPFLDKKQSFSPRREKVSKQVKDYLRSLYAKPEQDADVLRASNDPQTVKLQRLGPSKGFWAKLCYYLASFFR